jgi:hypothetical protein
MRESPDTGTPEALLEAMRIQTHTRRRLRELQALRQTDGRRARRGLVIAASNPHACCTQHDDFDTKQHGCVWAGEP